MRNSGIDALRVVAIVAIVAGHVWVDGTINELLYIWHVPIFFFLAGYFWTSGRKLSTDLRNRWETLMRPYLFWLLTIGVVYVIIEFVRDELSLRDAAGFVLGGAFLTRPFTAFWFVTALIGASVLFRLAEKFPTWVGVGIALVGLVLAYIFPTTISKIPYSLGVAVPALLFMYTGKIARNLKNKIRYSALLGLAFCMTGFVAVFLGLVAPLNMKGAEFGTPVISMIAAVLISCGLTWVFDRLGTGFGPVLRRIISELATTGFAVVLTHAFVLYLLDTPRDRGNPDFFLALFIPWAVAVFLRRTRLSAWALGTPRVSWESKPESMKSETRSVDNP